MIARRRAAASAAAIAFCAAGAVTAAAPSAHVAGRYYTLETTALRIVVYACGFSGHGFTFSPAFGEVLDLVTAGATRHEIGFLSASRSGGVPGSRQPEEPTQSRAVAVA